VTFINLAKGLKIPADSGQIVAHAPNNMSLASEPAGYIILSNALMQPFLQLMTNAGLNAQALLAQVMGGKIGQGIDLNNPGSGLQDMMKLGIVDPARVTKEAIQNAISVAGTAMTMGALVVDVPKEEKSGAPDMGAMGGMM
jgi:chaperonin GroEL